MSETTKNYWAECLADAAESCGLTVTAEQLATLAAAAESGHENYSMAFYSPPASDRITDIRRDDDRRYRELEREFAAYRERAEKAVGKALGQYPDTRITIGRDGNVLRHGGRTEVVQSS